jgi:hypothetical protein
VDAAAAERRGSDSYGREVAVSSGIGVGMAALITVLWIGVVHCLVGML